MQPRVVLDQSTTPDGKSLELVLEQGHHVIRLDGAPLMSSKMRGSEEAMATFAREHLGEREGLCVLIGGLGMGFTLRATLDAFGNADQVHVAELMPDIVRYNRDWLSEATDRPLDDPRVTLTTGDVRKQLQQGKWDAILLDVDNGPDALSVRSNERLYSAKGVAILAAALKPGGVMIVWSAYESPRFLEDLCRAGLQARTARVRARWPLKKGPKHTLFIGTKSELLSRTTH